ncbi:MAG: UPF0280 family protein [Clostridia bacterium]|nr:UPF0280 family protein [Clostridia bacterium]
MYLLEAPGRVRVEYGPVSMVIRAEAGGVPLTEAAIKGAEAAVANLDALARFQEVARRPITRVAESEAYPPVLRRMIDAARRTGAADVTPMVAVAGAMAELVGETVVAAGAKTVIVDNGGDIALFLEPHRTIRVGVVADVSRKEVPLVIPVEGTAGIGGICTSGLGGRSFTKGVATAAVAIGSSAPVADACATLIANSTLVDDPAVEQVRAELLDPDTDIAGHLVTVRVGSLPPEAVARALAQGLEQGRRFINRGLLQGVVLVVQGQVRMWPENIAVPQQK